MSNYQDRPSNVDREAMREFIVTREQFDRLQVALVQVLLGCPEHLAPEAIERSYPVCTAVCVDELRKRGLCANQYQVNRFLQRHGDLVPIVAKTRVWSKAVIDLFADELAAAGYYMPQAIERMAQGRTAQEAVDEIGAQLDAKIVEVRAAIDAEEKAAHATSERVIGMKETYASN